MRSAVLAEELLEVGTVSEQLERGGQKADRGLLTRREHVGGDPHHVDHVRRGTVGEGRGGQPGQHIIAGLAPAVLDVGRQPLVEELEGTVAERTRPCAAESLGFGAVAALQLLAEPLVVGLGHTKQVGDHVQREGSGVVLDELALPPCGELVDLAVGVPPHELLVLPEPLGRNQAHQHASVGLVFRRVHRQDLVAEGQFFAVLLDELADVVALEWDGEAGERTRHGVARRERGGVGVDADRLVVAGHHDHPVVGLGLHRALRSQVVVVGIGVGDQLVAPEEVDLFEVAHGFSSALRSPDPRARWRTTFS